MIYKRADKLTVEYYMTSKILIDDLNEYDQR